MSVHVEMQEGWMQSIEVPFVSGLVLKYERQKAGLSQVAMVRAMKDAGFHFDSPRISRIEGRQMVNPMDEARYRQAIEVALAARAAREAEAGK